MCQSLFVYCTAADGSLPLRCDAMRCVRASQENHIRGGEQRTLSGFIQRLFFFSSSFLFSPFFYVGKYREIFWGKFSPFLTQKKKESEKEERVYVLIAVLVRCCYKGKIHRFDSIRSCCCCSHVLLVVVVVVYTSLYASHIAASRITRAPMMK